MGRRTVVLVVALLLATISAFAIWNFLTNAEDDAREGLVEVTVFRATELIERGADVTRASHAGNTPLYAAINTQWIPKSRHPQPTDYTRQSVVYLDLMRALLEAASRI